VTRQPLPAQGPFPIDRRSLLTVALSGAIGTVLLEAEDGADPIPAAIDAHARAYAELDRALARQEVLERALLQRFGGFDEAEFDGDPSWIALQAENAGRAVPDPGRAVHAGRKERAEAVRRRARSSGLPVDLCRCVIRTRRAGGALALSARGQ
jgi:hypothetical protein